MFTSQEVAVGLTSKVFKEIPKLEKQKIYIQQERLHWIPTLASLFMEGIADFSFCFSYLFKVCSLLHLLILLLLLLPVLLYFNCKLYGFCTLQSTTLLNFSYILQYTVGGFLLSIFFVCVCVLLRNSYIVAFILSPFLYVFRLFFYRIFYTWKPQKHRLICACTMYSVQIYL